MKKLLILLLLSLGFTGSSYAKMCPDGSYVGGNICTLCPNGQYVGGRTCQLAPDGSYVAGSSNQNNIDNSGWDVMTQSAGDSGAAIGKALGDLFSSFGQSNNPMKGSRFYEQGTTWIWQSGNGYGSDGMSCSYIDYGVFSCNNGITYTTNPNVAGTPVRGSDGTSYQSNLGNGGNPDYYCVASNFGSNCCGNQASKTCR
jgi:hypothetical protein